MSGPPRTDAQVLGEAITILRSQFTITVESAAFQMGCDAERLRRYERGELPLCEAALVLAQLGAGLAFLVLAEGRHHHLPGQTLRAGAIPDKAVTEARMI